MQAFASSRRRRSISPAAGSATATRTLWASWVILAGDLRLFFSGDTGYHAGFKTIGERYGPFDVTMLETGAYDAPVARRSHAARTDAAGPPRPRGRWLMPVHNGTFDLAMHAWHEPLDRIHALAEARRRAADDAPDRAGGRHEGAVGDHRLVGEGRLTTREGKPCRKRIGIAARSAARAVSKAS